MEPVDDPPRAPPANGNGSHAQSEHHKGKRKASLLNLPAPSSFVPIKQLQRLWWSKDTVAVVTGGNKGLGLEIVRQLATEGLTVVLTARDAAKGVDAVDALRAEGIESVGFHQLDVTKSQSVEDLAAWLQQEFGGIDILVNCAGIHCYSESYEDAVETFETNYFGVKRVTTALLPLMRASHSGARIVNVSSQAATLERFRTSGFKTKFSNVDCLSEGMVDDLVAKYLKEVKAGKWKDAEKGEWALNNFTYMKSKLALNTYTQILARSLTFQQPHNHKIYVNAMCPGSVQVDMAAFLVRKPTEVGHDIFHDVFGGCTIQSLKVGADTAVWLALLPRAGYPNGEFFAEKKEIAF